jgi:NADH-quinone oxidoreductase subunit J
MNLQVVVFIILAMVGLVGAVGTVALRNIVHAALMLAVSFFAVAGIFVLLEAEFLFAVQILIYVGAIITLILFAIMLTRGVTGQRVRQTNNQALPAAILAIVFFVAVLVPMIMGTRWLISTRTPPAPAHAIALLGEELLGPYVLPFEVAAVLLLVALVGAIIVARER